MQMKSLNPLGSRRVNGLAPKSQTLGSAAWFDAGILLAALTTGVAQPVITVQPANQLAGAGGNVTFSVVATGTNPKYYQWRFNEVDLPGKTSFNLVMTNVQLTNSGGYTVVVTNAAGAVTSVVATLTVEANLSRGWVRIPTDPASTPSGREGCALVYDEKREVIVMYGGGNDTWEWNGRTWRLLSTNGPVVGLAGTAYDVARDRMVIYGGYWTNGALTNWMHSRQLWEWDGQSWNYITTGTAEGLDGQMTMVYDQALGKVIRHGGILDGNVLMNPDTTTYQWDGTNWTPLASGTFKRGGQKAAYDSVRGRTVMFGGSSIARGFWTRDTWEFDGAEWTQVATNGPAGRVFHAMAFDSYRGVVVLYGGTDVFAGDTNFNDTWEWDGVQWTKVNVSGTTAHNNLGMAYDPKRRKVVLIGGTPGIHDQWLNETWEYGLLPLQLSVSAPQADGSLKIEWTGEAPPYQLQSRTNLNEGDWQDEGAPTDQTSATVQRTGDAKFFRVVSLFGQSQ